MQLRFAKMHGLGNDFMVVDLVTQRLDPAPAQVRAWGDRRTGIGFDQFLAVLPPDCPDMDFRYRILNADGSEAEQCGNGARCLARFVVDERLTVKRQLRWQSASGTVRTRLLRGGDVEVDVGVPSTEPQAVPFAADAAQSAQNGARTQGHAICHSVDVGGSRVNITPVSMGNPHAVVFVDDVSCAEVERIGAGLQSHACFPEQVNVGFLQVVNRGFGHLRVYERGVGETQGLRQRRLRGDGGRPPARSLRRARQALSARRQGTRDLGGPGRPGQAHGRGEIRLQGVHDGRCKC